MVGFGRHRDVAHCQPHDGAGQHAGVFLAAPHPARHERFGQPRRAVVDDRRAVGGDDLQQVGLGATGQQRDHQRVGRRLGEEVAESLQKGGVDVADVVVDRVVDLVDEPVGQPQRIPLGQALPGAELVVDGLAADAGGARHVRQRDRRPVAVEQQLTHAVEDGVAQQHPRRFGVGHALSDSSIGGAAHTRDNIASR